MCSLLHFCPTQAYHYLTWKHCTTTAQSQWLLHTTTALCCLNSALPLHHYTATLHFCTAPPLQGAATLFYTTTTTYKARSSATLSSTSALQHCTTASFHHYYYRLPDNSITSLLYSTSAFQCRTALLHNTTATASRCAKSPSIAQCTTSLHARLVHGTAHNSTVIALLQCA